MTERRLEASPLRDGLDRFILAPAWACLAVLALVASSTDARAGEGEPKSPGRTVPKTVRFNRDVRPILADKCLLCHGPDATQRKGELRLDTLKDATAAAASGEPAVVPGDVDASELVRRIISDDGDERMPPAKTKKSLSAAEVQTLKTWIAEGAEYEGHWAFVPPVASDAPTVSRSDWTRNPIDAWILKQLDKEGLAPSPEAEKVVLIRRLSLDLIGLPPTIAEVDAFLADDRGDAYERLVDRLLDSPHYGERWGRIWLDAARYADSDGYEKDKLRKVHFYRDWVVQAINRDLPYDRFIVEQLAGDLLPKPTQDQLVATGFLRNSMINEEGGIDPEQFRMEAMFDRMEAIGKGVLGLTIQCAQCHTHKYDPITHEEYYQMFAFLNSTHEANIAVYSPAELTKQADLLRAIHETESKLRADHPDWAERMGRWEESTRDRGPSWQVVRTNIDANNGSGQKHYLLDDGSLLAAGYAPTLHTTQFTALKPVPRVSAVRLELLNDPSLPLSGPGRSTKGLFALTDFHVEVAPADKPNERQEVKIVRATADVSPPETELEPIFDDRSKKRRVTGPIAFAIDGKVETAWGIDAGPGRRNVPRNAVFVLEKPVSFPAGVIVTFKLDQKHGGWNSDDNQNNNLGRFRFSTTDAPNAEADPVPAGVRAILAIDRAKRTPDQTAVVFSYFRTTVPEWKGADDHIDALWKQHPEGSSQLVLEDRERPRETHLLQRGDFLKPGKPVVPGTPAFLNPLPTDKPANRLTFAEWLVDRQAPTTARACVNRVWQAYFGAGIVATSEDLGSQSEAPSHPELLDWLAVDFMDHGWSLKRLQRLIVNSATYRQTSRVSPDLAAKDPYNRLLARGPRQRVDAEIVRDVTLAASGLLDRHVGGDSVFPPAPAFLFEPPSSYGPKQWPEASGTARYRRALYTFRYRSVPYPMLQAFDAPNGDFSCVRRPKSNTPLQALTLLNEPIALDCARSLAALTLKDGGATDADRIAFAFRRCVARKPTAEEVEVLSSLLKRQVERFTAGEVDPRELAADQPATGVAPARLASWTVLARVLLNLDETITKE
ncbi:MAG: PSD1 and planctomycete cytochrome C domain-containing protein [Paludisphaera borealis]|uniref:PSD1 and planctomycete cytochrome C domain-containing protein n=1 Tax=Paludisphaera borealis TaxID=1387353 RepID=UPI00284C4BD2|nr:PSD1 and planctomycete cytochrome C domain-containing protein [Paludisphaera borealis]MDR3622424.1 PSD1 and planctomycete cytochrome C domain-containing protein [Paludisphaera borealis]